MCVECEQERIFDIAVKGQKAARVAFARGRFYEIGFPDIPAEATLEGDFTETGLPPDHSP